MSFTYIRRAAVALALITTAGCTVKDTQAPPLSGPSGLALILTVTASPDSISQDGGSQSTIKVTAIGPDGRPVSGLPIRVDMMVNGVAQDFGTLSARAIVTNGDGVATVVFTAPPSPPNGVFGTCGSLPGTCVSIVATPTGTNFDTANPQSVKIRLVPPGILLPPPDTPTASFQFSPINVGPNQAITFDGTASCGGPVSGGTCQSASQIVSYTWNFGDGSTDSGSVVRHNFANAATYTVTLTVTNDRGVAASTTRVVTVSPSSLPTAKFTVSPTTIRANVTTAFFNASGSTAATGRTIRTYDWDFGDGAVHGAGVTTTHLYTAANVYTVTLTVTDDLGQQASTTGTVTVIP